MAVPPKHCTFREAGQPGQLPRADHPDRASATSQEDIARNLDDNDAAARAKVPTHLYSCTPQQGSHSAASEFEPSEDEVSWGWALVWKPLKAVCLVAPAFAFAFAFPFGIHRLFFALGPRFWGLAPLLSFLFFSGRELESSLGPTSFHMTLPNPLIRVPPIFFWWRSGWRGDAELGRSQARTRA